MSFVIGKFANVTQAYNFLSDGCLFWFVERTYYIFVQRSWRRLMHLFFSQNLTGTSFTCINGSFSLFTMFATFEVAIVLKNVTIAQSAINQQLIMEVSLRHSLVIERNCQMLKRVPTTSMLCDIFPLFNLLISIYIYYYDIVYYKYCIDSDLPLKKSIIYQLWNWQKHFHGHFKLVTSI